MIHGKIQITVPSDKLVIGNPVDRAIVEVMEISGGMTSIEGHGAWRDPNGVIAHEDVLQISFLTKANEVEIMVGLLEVIRLLIQGGEQAVLVESWGASYRWEMFTQEDFK